MKKTVLLFVMTAFSVVLTGCIDITYTGQTFPALTAGSPVAFYNVDEPLPEGKYHAIGRAELTAPDDTDSEDIRKKLINCALEKGADVVAVRDFKRVQTGFLHKTGSLDGPTGSWTRDGRNAGGDYIYSNSFGETAVETKPQEVYEIRVKALFLVEQARFEEVVRTYRKELKTLDEIAEEQATNPATAATYEEMLKLRSPVTPEAAAAAKPESENTPEREPVQIELQSSNAPVAL